MKCQGLLFLTDFLNCYKLITRYIFCNSCFNLSSEKIGKPYLFSDIIIIFSKLQFFTAIGSLATSSKIDHIVIFLGGLNM